jgi:hypothetical protein
LIFHRSLIREFSLIAIAVVGVLLAIILTRLLILLLGKAATGDVIPEAVLGLIAFGILNYLPVLLGIAVFIAVLLALTRSYRDSEMTVWFTSGLSIGAWVRPVLQFSLPIAVVCALLSLAIAPWSQAQSVEYQRLLESRDEVSSVTPGRLPRVAQRRPRVLRRQALRGRQHRQQRLRAIDAEQPHGRDGGEEGLHRDRGERRPLRRAAQRPALRGHARHARLPHGGLRALRAAHRAARGEALRPVEQGHLDARPASPSASPTRWPSCIGASRCRSPC